MKFQKRAVCALFLICTAAAGLLAGCGGKAAEREEAPPPALSFVTVSFDTMGGEPLSDMSVRAGERLKLPEARREGYRFTGWSGEADGGAAADGGTGFVQDTTLYARWQPETVTLRYADEDGSAQTAAFGTELTLRTGAAAPKGEKLYGWAFTASAELPDLLPGAVFSARDAMLYPVFGDARFSGGLGTKAHPFEIGSFAELMHIGELLGDAHCFKLTSDIDAGARTVLPLGDFYGSLDGAGFTVHDLQINAESGAGLFRSVHGTVKNLHMKGADISAGTNAGGICGAVYGLLEGCSVTGQITALQNAGGLCGAVYGGRVEHCESGADVHCLKKNGGGITGFMGTFKGRVPLAADCLTRGNVTGTYATGGIAGCAVDARLLRCDSAGSVTAVSALDTLSATGGVAGELRMGCEVTECISRGSVVSTAPTFYSATGGIAGLVRYLDMDGVLVKDPPVLTVIGQCVVTARVSVTENDVPGALVGVCYTGCSLFGNTHETLSIKETGISLASDIIQTQGHQ